MRWHNDRNIKQYPNNGEWNVIFVWAFTFSSNFLILKCSASVLYMNIKYVCTNVVSKGLYPENEMSIIKMITITYKLIAFVFFSVMAMIAHEKIRGFSLLLKLKQKLMKNLKYNHNNNFRKWKTFYFLFWWVNSRSDKYLCETIQKLCFFCEMKNIV